MKCMDETITAQKKASINSNWRKNRHLTTIIAFSLGYNYKNHQLRKVSLQYFDKFPFPVQSKSRLSTLRLGNWQEFPFPIRSKSRSSTPKLGNSQEISTFVQPDSKNRTLINCVKLQPTNQLDWSLELERFPLSLSLT